MTRMGVSQPRVPAVRRQTSTYRDRRWRLAEDAPRACRILTILPPMLQRSRGVPGVWVGMVEDGLDGFRCGGDSPRGRGDGSWVDSEVKGETQGREGLGGIEDTLFPVYDETGFSEGVYEDVTHVDGVCVGEGGTEAVIDVDDHSPTGVAAPVVQDGFQQSVEDVASWIGMFPDRLHRTRSSV